METLISNSLKFWLNRVQTERNLNRTGGDWQDSESRQLSGLPVTCCQDADANSPIVLKLFQVLCGSELSMGFVILLSRAEVLRWIILSCRTSSRLLAGRYFFLTGVSRQTQPANEGRRPGLCPDLHRLLSIKTLAVTPQGWRHLPPADLAINPQTSLTQTHSG